MQKWRRIWLRSRVSDRHGSGRTSFFISAVLGIGLALLAISLFDSSVRPVVTEMAKTRTGNAVTRIVNDAVSRTMSTQAIAYDDMITLQKDSSGQIIALTSNSVEMNRLRTQILDEVISKVNTLDSNELGVPLGNLSGFATLSEKGPLLPVRVLSVASADAAFRNQFTAAGINQSYHQVVLDVTVNVKLLIPGDTVETAITTQVSVAETIIVGKVPDAYLQFGEQLK